MACGASASQASSWWRCCIRRLLTVASFASGSPWVPQFGLGFHLRMDGYAWMFALLVTGMGALVVLYARYYMSPADPVPRFFSFLLAFMGAMLGIVLSGNLIQLVVFWELTSLSSFMLIAYWYHRADARRGARHGTHGHRGRRLVPAGGVLLLGRSPAATTSIECSRRATQIRAHRWYPAMLVLIAAGCVDQERAVSVSFLVAARHGGANARVGVPALGHDGEGGRVPARSTVAGPARAPICGLRSSAARGCARC